MKHYKFSVKLQRKYGNKSLRQGNQVISANDRMYHRVQATISQFLRDTARETAGAITVPFSEERPCECRVVIHPPTKRRMDPPNFNPTVKPLIDGLVDAGILTDDNSKVIRRHIFESGELSGDQNSYRFDIILQELQEEVEEDV